MRSNLSRWLQRISLLVVVIFYPGCTVTQKVSIYPDGSAKVISKTVMSKEEAKKNGIDGLTDKDIAERTKESKAEAQAKGLIVVSDEIYKKGDNIIEEMVAYAKDFTSSDPNMKFRKNEDGSVVLEKTVSVAELLQSQSIFKDMEIEETTVLPGKIVESKGYTVKGREASRKINKDLIDKLVKENKDVVLMIKCEPPTKEVIKEWEAFKKEMKEAEVKNEKEKKKSEDKEK